MATRLLLLEPPDDLRLVVVSSLALWTARVALPKQGSLASIIRTAAARLMSPAEPGIAQAGIETAIRVNDKTLKLLTIPIAPCHPRRTRGNPVGPGKHR